MSNLIKIPAVAPGPTACSSFFDNLINWLVFAEKLCVAMASRIACRRSRRAMDDLLFAFGFSVTCCLLPRSSSGLECSDRIRRFRYRADANSISATGYRWRFQGDERKSGFTLCFSKRVNQHTSSGQQRHSNSVVTPQGSFLAVCSLSVSLRVGYGRLAQAQDRGGS